MFFPFLPALPFLGLMSLSCGGGYLFSVGESGDTSPHETGAAPDSQEPVETDADGDGYGESTDCDDENPAVSPGAQEIPYNGLDDDCDTSTPDDDLDSDGVYHDSDCDDTDPETHPGATDFLLDGTDQDCDGHDDGLEDLQLSIIQHEPISITEGELTGDKPQSKVWLHDGKWWCVLADSEGTWIWQLSDGNWSRHLRLSTHGAFRADCLSDGDLVHILLYDGEDQTGIISVAYDSASQSYGPWEEYGDFAGIPLSSGVETATIQQDGTGRLWVAWADTDQVWLSWADSPYDDWTRLPDPLASGLDDDDICLVVAIPDEVQPSIGVLWSNQNTGEFGFRVHLDADPPQDWGDTERPAAEGEFAGLALGDGMADDHMNAAVASDGTLYFAVKTSYDTDDYPLVVLLVRHHDGTWSPLDAQYQVDPGDLDVTRPVVLLDETPGFLLVAYTSRDSGDIMYRVSATATIGFSEQAPLITGGDIIHNVTSTKERFDDQVVLLAGDRESPGLAYGVTVTVDD